ncbi:CAMK/CAMKL protein kinase, variant [Capsaspora owczarzaki ATCC 30864]|nr:CAMK/CAMKL protein kinase, variant [Capsaspora owczarzaki ATCC 30864]
MEFAAGGELFDYIVARQNLKEVEARRVFRQIISAVSYCHQSALIHRDLKPENLLLDSDLNIKIIDFGFSNVYRTDMVLNTFCGSPYYAAPEMIVGQSYVGPEIDIWSMGVILYTLLCGHLPFDDDNLTRLYEKVLVGQFDLPETLSQMAKDLLVRMIRVEPGGRAPLEEIAKHPWVMEGYDTPVNAYLPPRLEIDEVDEVIFRQLLKYDFDAIEADEDLHRPGVNPAKGMYYLLCEKRDRDLKKFAAAAAANNAAALSASQSVAHMRSGSNTAMPMNVVPASAEEVAAAKAAATAQQSAQQSRLAQLREQRYSKLASDTRRSRTIASVPARAPESAGVVGQMMPSDIDPMQAMVNARQAHLQASGGSSSGGVITVTAPIAVAPSLGPSIGERVQSVNHNISGGALPSSPLPIEPLGDLSAPVKPVQQQPSATTAAAAAAAATATTAAPVAAAAPAAAAPAMTPAERMQMLMANAKAHQAKKASEGAAPQAAAEPAVAAAAAAAAAVTPAPVAAAPVVASNASETSMDSSKPDSAESTPTSSGASSAVGSPNSSQTQMAPVDEPRKTVVVAGKGSGAVKFALPAGQQPEEDEPEDELPVPDLPASSTPATAATATASSAGPMTTTAAAAAGGAVPPASSVAKSSAKAAGDAQKKKRFLSLDGAMSSFIAAFGRKKASQPTANGAIGEAGEEGTAEEPAEDVSGNAQDAGTVDANGVRELPANDLRTLKGFYDVSTTSSKPVPDIITEISRVLGEIQIDYSWNNVTVSCMQHVELVTTVTTAGGTVIQMNKSPAALAAAQAKATQFEIEICRVPKLNLCGLHFRRVSGDIWAYRKICHRLFNSLQL